MFNRKIKPICLYCFHSEEGPVEFQLRCPRKGVVTFDFHCRAYLYDPTKRVPKRPKKRPPETLEVFEL